MYKFYEKNIAVKIIITNHHIFYRKYDDYYDFLFIKKVNIYNNLLNILYFYK